MYYYYFRCLTVNKGGQYMNEKDEIIQKIQDIQDKWILKQILKYIELITK